MKTLGTLLAMGAALAAAKASAAAIQGGDAVPGHPGLTYLDLIRQAVPGLAANAADGQIEGRLAKPFRHLAGAAYEGPPPDPVALDFIEDRRIRVGGKPRLVVFADLGPDPDRVQSTALLLLFDDAPKPRLLDAADVSIDKDTEIAEDVTLPLGPGDDGIVTYSEHNDADLTMGGYMIVSPIGDRLRMVDMVPITSARACGWSGIESSSFASAPDSARPYRRIELTVRAKFTRTDEDCGDQPLPKARTEVFRASYRWNPAHRAYQATRSDLKRLSALNQTAF
jgi:hypothetical protein